jgi:hypothetical protein
MAKSWRGVVSGPAEASVGYIDVAVAENTGQTLSSLNTRLARKGYRVENAMSGADVLFGASGMIVASDPATGRKMRFVELNTPAGPVLRVFFNDPAPEFAK